MAFLYSMCMRGLSIPDSGYGGVDATEADEYNMVQTPCYVVTRGGSSPRSKGG